MSRWLKTIVRCWGDFIMGCFNDLVEGYKKSEMSDRIKKGYNPYTGEMDCSSKPPLQPDLMQREMADIGVVGPTLPPQVRLAMFNAGRPDDEKVTLSGSGMSMTRQMDIWDSAGMPYGGGGKLYKIV